ncbi:MAG: hypothetical protein WA192_02415 [Candidatus Acidiferrales bacterium]
MARKGVHHGRRRARSGRAVCAAVLAVAFACLLAPRARADAGVLLNESLDTSVARITGSGHSAVYLSRICPDNSPVRMRLCRPGEQGSVLSNYTTLGEDQPYEWNIVPLSVYLYGVEDPRDRPLVSSKAIKAALEERYRDKYLAAICSEERCRKGKSAEWREMVGATLERSMYLFLVKTTVEQDRALIAEFNSQPNVNHFNGMTRNCADFVRRVMNIYYPGAVRPDYLNDFFMTSPKAVAHSLTRYAAKHPESDFRVLHFSQVPGTIKRSSECRSGTEQLYHSKKLVIPLAYFAWQGVPAVAISYAITGRFNPEHQFETHPAADMAGSDSDFQPVRGGGYTVSVQQLAAEEALERDTIVGTKDEWNEYQGQLTALVNQAISSEVLPDREYLKHVFKTLTETSTISADANGALWLNFPGQETPLRVGISASNIFAPGSDSQYGYQIILARMEGELKSPKHSRETMLEFKQDWVLLAEVRAKGPAIAAARRASQEDAPVVTAMGAAARPGMPAAASESF